MISLFKPIFLAACFIGILSNAPTHAGGIDAACTQSAHCIPEYFSSVYSQTHDSSCDCDCHENHSVPLSLTIELATAGHRQEVQSIISPEISQDRDVCCAKDIARALSSQRQASVSCHISTTILRI